MKTKRYSNGLYEVVDNEGRAWWLAQDEKTKKWEVSKMHQLFSLIEKKKVDVVLENQFVAQDIFKKKFPLFETSLFYKN